MNSCKTIWQSLMLVSLLWSQSGVAKGIKIGNVELGSKGVCESKDPETGEKYKVAITPVLETGELKYRIAVNHLLGKPKLVWDPNSRKYEGAECSTSETDEKTAYICKINPESDEPSLLMMEKQEDGYYLKLTTLKLTKGGMKTSDLELGTGFTCDVDKVIQKNTVLAPEDDPNLNQGLEAGITSLDDLFDDESQANSELAKLLAEARAVRAKFGIPESKAITRKDRTQPRQKLPSLSIEDGADSKDNSRFRPDYPRDSYGHILLLDPDEAHFADEAIADDWDDSEDEEASGEGQL